MLLAIELLFGAGCGLWVGYTWGYQQGFDAGCNKILQQAGVLMQGYLGDRDVDHSGEAGA